MIIEEPHRKCYDAHQNSQVQVRQGQRADYLVQTFKNGSCLRENPCNYWHVPECTKFNVLGGCSFGGNCAYKHTAKPADENGKISIDRISHSIE